MDFEDLPKGIASSNAVVIAGRLGRISGGRVLDVGTGGGAFIDTVCTSYSLHHLANVDGVMREMKRVLKPGGNLILQEVYCDGDQTEAQRADRLQHEWGAKIDMQLGITHSKTFTRQQIVDIVNSLGLSSVDFYDSTHLVNCLFCDKRLQCEDPKNQATFHDSIKDIDNTMKRIDDISDLEMRNLLKEEGERIKEFIGEHGVASASYIMVIGRA